MAKKATKALAASNAAALRTLHLSSLAINALFILYRFLYHRSSTSIKAIFLYLLFSAPAFVIQFYFEKLSRPRYAGNGRGNGLGDVLKAGEDLAGQGMMEYLWDVVYVTWGCLLIVMVAGERGWWVWGLIPAYASYLAFGMYKKVRGGGLGGLMGGGAAGGEEIEMDELAAAGDGSGMSKRQQKLEKRGGQKVRYR